MVENPFPGTNPYLEQRWGDMHSALIAYGRDMIQDSLPDDLRARMQERVFIESDVKERGYYPDVEVYEIPGSRKHARTQSAAVSTVDPILIRMPYVQITESFIEIIDVKTGGRVVTIVEFISRSNKSPGKGRKTYFQKRALAMDGDVNFVEIDLLRGGKPVTLADPQLLAPQKRAPYHAVIWRAAREDTIEYYPFPLRQRLPAIAIPLRPTDSVAPLDLQALINLCYTRGRYDDTDYIAPLDPPLSSDDAQWAASLTTKS
jgi:hypothetical protein